MRRAQTWHIIGRGFNGWHATGVNVRSSGGDLTSYAPEAVDGALVYDAAACERDPAQCDAFVTHVYRGPMLDPELPPDGVKRFGDLERQTARMMLPALGGDFATYAAAAQSEQFHGLDYVGIGVYEALLRAIPGIRFGRVRRGAVEWEVTP